MNETIIRKLADLKAQINELNAMVREELSFWSRLEKARESWKEASND